MSTTPAASRLTVAANSALILPGSGVFDKPLPVAGRTKVLVGGGPKCRALAIIGPILSVKEARESFCRTIWGPPSKTVAYALTLIHLGSRKVSLSPSTPNPTHDWMQQQARNVSMRAEEEGIDVRFLIHDRDTKFTEALDEHFRQGDGGVVRRPY